MEKKDIVVICFGTTEIAGDALGPRTGSLLVEKYRLPVFVYGTEKRPVTAKSMTDAIEFVSAVHRGALVVAVDASLGAAGRVGEIIVRGDGVCPAGAGGSKKRFGDLGILGVVAANEKNSLSALLTVNADNVFKLADKVAFLLNEAIRGTAAL